MSDALVFAAVAVAIPVGFTVGWKICEWWIGPWLERRGWM